MTRIGEGMTWYRDMAGVVLDCRCCVSILDIHPDRDPGDAGLKRRLGMLDLLVRIQMLLDLYPIHGIATMLLCCQYLPTRARRGCECSISVGYDSSHRCERRCMVRSPVLFDRCTCLVCCMLLVALVCFSGSPFAEDHALLTLMSMWLC